jgi:hypothetical protein
MSEEWIKKPSGDYTKCPYNTEDQFKQDGLKLSIDIEDLARQWIKQAIYLYPYNFLVSEENLGDNPEAVKAFAAELMKTIKGIPDENDWLWSWLDIQWRSQNE